jgi:hypothetical protein
MMCFRPRVVKCYHGVRNQQKLVGIWKKGQRVYILRKHVGLSLLNTEEYGIEEEED